MQKRCNFNRPCATVMSQPMQLHSNSKCRLFITRKLRWIEQLWFVTWNLQRNHSAWHIVKYRKPFMLRKDTYCTWRQLMPRHLVLEEWQLFFMLTKLRTSRLKSKMMTCNNWTAKVTQSGVNTYCYGTENKISTVYRIVSYLFQAKRCVANVSVAAKANSSACQILKNHTQAFSHNRTARLECDKRLVV